MASADGYLNGHSEHGLLKSSITLPIPMSNTAQ